MPQNQLQELFREKVTKAKPSSVNWTRRRDEWIKAVAALYADLERKFEATKAKVSVERRDKKVSEINIGEYTIPELVLHVANETVVFSPKGTNVYGAKGRIDVLGDLGEGTMVLQPKGHWSIVVSRTPALRLSPLAPDSLAELLRGVMRP